MPETATRLTGPAAEEAMRRMTRRSFTVGAVAALAGFGAWNWLGSVTTEDDLPWPLRRLLRFNQVLGEAYASPRHLAPTFPADSAAGSPRTNGLRGLENDIDATGWEVHVQHEGRASEQAVRLDAVQALPRLELVTELKCVEGWSEIMQFGGVRFIDFLTHFGLGTRSGRPFNPEADPQDLFHYVYLATPDENYYVGLDIASALHPQTLLCDTMNGQPLSREHGAPLRLYLAVKYGFKSLKRIGIIRFSDTRPRDYWVERGYDWYAGL
jgi:DMSO/TMAO reductase YedYZ molybdopterin-dependent catalytic subunit